MTTEDMLVSESINWSASASVKGGPVVSSAGVTEADGYDKFEVALKPGDTRTINLAPGNWDSLQLLMLTPSASEDKFKYDAGSGDTALTGPLLLVGSAATGLLGKKPATLKFTNSSTKPLSVDVLVARSA